MKGLFLKLLSFHSSILYLLYIAISYWLLMNSQKNYFDFSRYVKKMKAALTIWGSPDFDLSQVASVFDDFKPIEVDTAVLNKYFDSESFVLSSFKNCLGIIIENFLKALNRQLSDFFYGGVFDE